MPDIDQAQEFLADENGLAVISTTQADGRVLSSVVNCGVMDHPVTGVSCVAFVAGGGAIRLSHIRRGSQATIAIRRGWKWVAVTGPADIIGPSELPASMDAEDLRLLLRDVFRAAGGKHDNFDEYDRAMVDEARVAVFVTPSRVIGAG